MRSTLYKHPRPVVIIPSLLLAVIVGLWGGITIRYGSIRAAIVAQRGYVVVADSSLLSFGSLKVGTVTEVVFTVRNLSGKPVRIVGGSSSCDCMLVENLPTLLGPRATQTITISVHGNDVGHFSRSVELYIDSPRQTRLPLIVEGEIVPDQGGSHSVESKTGFSQGS